MDFNKLVREFQDFQLQHNIALQIPISNFQAPMTFNSQFNSINNSPLSWAKHPNQTSTLPSSAHISPSSALRWHQDWGIYLLCWRFLRHWEERGGYLDISQPRFGRGSFGKLSPGRERRKVGRVLSRGGYWLLASLGWTRLVLCWGWEWPRWRWCRALCSLSSSRVS